LALYPIGACDKADPSWLLYFDVASLCGRPGKLHQDAISALAAGLLPAPFDSNMGKEKI